MPEPWLRNTHTNLEAVLRQTIHALELASEDATRWAIPLTEAQLNLSPYDLPSVAFQLRHIVRSLDRLLTYAEARALTQSQLYLLETEHDPIGKQELLREFTTGLTEAMTRLQAFDPKDFQQPRSVGRDRLPTTLAGLVVHAAEHTQRHAGQMVTTAKLVAALAK